MFEHSGEILFHPEATAELREAVAFYMERNPGIADDFKHRIKETVSLIQENPNLFPAQTSTPETRKAVIQQFPFSIIYIIRPEYIWIIGLAHGSRRPGYWRSRM